MVSIFETIDREVNQNLKFWNVPDELSTQDIAEKEMHEGELQFLMPDGSWKTKNMILTESRLYYTDKSLINPKRMAVIIWKKLEPFTEESDKEERFGFRLVQGAIYQDFYTSTPDMLEVWLEKLSRIVILNDLEDDFAIIKEIGSGNYAKVYLAQDVHELKEYAVKSINKAAIWSSSRSTAALISEINVMKKLHHPSLVTLHKVYENEKFVHLILDYVPGGDLFHRIIERNIFSERTAANLMKNLLEAVEYMHSLNIVHRDLKPENILMSNSECDWEFKIADFGLACQSSENELLRCGSPGYVAPEILKKAAYGKKVDIFSTGIILYVVLSSRAPFFGKNANEILTKNKECKIYFQDKYWKNISKEGIDCVLKLTESNPDKRPSAREALRHPWLSMTHSKVSRDVLVIPRSPSEEQNEIGISSELMRRFNEGRSGPKEQMAKPGRNEEEKKAIDPNKLTAKPWKNTLSRLRDADSSLN